MGICVCCLDHSDDAYGLQLYRLIFAMPKWYVKSPLIAVNAYFSPELWLILVVSCLIC